MELSLPGNGPEKRTGPIVTAEIIDDVTPEYLRDALSGPAAVIADSWRMADSAVQEYTELIHTNTKTDVSELTDELAAKPPRKHQRTIDRKAARVADMQSIRDVIAARRQVLTTMRSVLSSEAPIEQSTPGIDALVTVGSLASRQTIGSVDGLPKPESTAKIRSAFADVFLAQCQVTGFLASVIQNNPQAIHTVAEWVRDVHERDDGEFRPILQALWSDVHDPEFPGFFAGAAAEVSEQINPLEYVVEFVDSLSPEVDDEQNLEKSKMRESLEALRNLSASLDPSRNEADDTKDITPQPATPALNPSNS